jgi:hypothetical protein
MCTSIRMGRSRTSNGADGLVKKSGLDALVWVSRRDDWLTRL